MRYAILSDIHANEEALRAVLSDVRQRSVDRIVSLGDVVGFNASPDECADLLRDAGVIGVAGNHDLVAVGRAEPDRFAVRARKAIAWTRQRISPETRRYLEALPEFVDVDRAFVACHGSLRSAHHYVNTVEALQQMSQDLAERWPGRLLCFYGHTHRRAVHQPGEDGPPILPRGEIALTRGTTYLINPGSVGEPRDGVARASYAILDTASARLEYHAIAYPRAVTLRRARQAGLPPPRRRLAAVARSILAKLRVRR
jgi:predicted phosphodiesterase